MTLSKEQAIDILKKVSPYSRTFTVSRRKGIKVCPRCEGRGYYYTEELTDYHRGEYRDEHHKCRPCGGDGRLTVTVDAISLDGIMIRDQILEVPYTQDPITKNEWDSFGMPFTIDKD